MEIRSLLAIDLASICIFQAQNTTDEMFLKFWRTSRGHDGLPAPLSPHTGSSALLAPKIPAWACAEIMVYHTAKSSVRMTPWAWARSPVQPRLYGTQG